MVGIPKPEDGLLVLVEVVGPSGEAPLPSPTEALQRKRWRILKATVWSQAPENPEGFGCAFPTVTSAG
eukprot:1178280-Prorocentrum_minimum.AAC.2